MNPAHALFTQVIQAATLQEAVALAADAPERPQAEIDAAIVGIFTEMDTAAIATALWRGFNEATPKERPKKMARNFDVHTFLVQLKEQCIMPEEENQLPAANQLDMQQLLDRILVLTKKPKRAIQVKLLRGYYIALQLKLSQPWGAIAASLLGRACKDPSSNSALREPLQLYKLVTEQRLYALRFLQPKMGTLALLLQQSSEICEAIGDDAFWHADPPTTVVVQQGEHAMEVIDIDWLCPQ